MADPASLGVAAVAVGTYWFLQEVFGHGGPKVEYTQDPATLGVLADQASMIEEKHKELKEAFDEARRMSDPDFFEQKQDEIFGSFLTKLGKKSCVTPSRFQGRRNVLFIGDVSVGKTSLINALFRLRLPTGKGDTTEDVESVHEDGDLLLWDSPGANNNFAFYSRDMLNYIQAASYVVVLFKTGLGTASKIVRVVDSLKEKKEYVCVRTQCDLFTQPQKRIEASLEEETMKDRKELKKIGIPDAPLLMTSANEPEDKRFDNAELRRRIRGE